MLSFFFHLNFSAEEEPMTAQIPSSPSAQLKWKQGKGEWDYGKYIQTLVMKPRKASNIRLGLSPIYVERERETKKKKSRFGKPFSTNIKILCFNLKCCLRFSKYRLPDWKDSFPQTYQILQFTYMMRFS